MMGRQTGDQSQLFYLFNLEERIPAGHLLRRTNPVVVRVLAEIREKLAPFYSEIGRPSIDPELMIRMLIVGCLGVREVDIGQILQDVSMIHGAMLVDDVKKVSTPRISIR